MTTPLANTVATNGVGLDLDSTFCVKPSLPGKLFWWRPADGRRWLWRFSSIVGLSIQRLGLDVQHAPELVVRAGGCWEPLHCWDW